MIAAITDIMTQLQSEGAQVPLKSFIINLLFAGLLGYLLSLLYLYCGRSLSNRGEFGRNFVLISMTTMLIISIVKSSLALSLGLVGALSIVRFRSAIKEPEELCYLFLAVGIGLGFGAGQGVVTMVAFTVIAIVIWLKNNLTLKKMPVSNIHLVVSSQGETGMAFNRVRTTVQEASETFAIRRLEESHDWFEASFLVSFESPGQMESCSRALRSLGDQVKVSFMDQKGLGW